MVRSRGSSAQRLGSAVQVARPIDQIYLPTLTLRPAVTKPDSVGPSA